jgi:hypothetical protein
MGSQNPRFEMIYYPSLISEKYFVDQGESGIQYTFIVTKNLVIEKIHEISHFILVD